MKRKFTATRIRTTRNFLIVYVTVEFGASMRFIAIQVPWGIVAEHHQGITERLEAIYLAQLEADADVQYLPLEVWE